MSWLDVNIAVNVSLHQYNVTQKVEKSRQQPAALFDLIIFMQEQNDHVYLLYF